jgi:DNA-binding response OmpR family regulator
MNTRKPIMLLEDDKIDAMTVKRALKEINIVNKLIVFANGEKGLAYLNQKDNPEPGIILLDLNMPRMNGIEFLQNLKQDDTLKKIPVIVLTTSKEEQDKINSFKLGVAGYMIKPVDYVQFIETVKAINLYWTLSEFP